MRSRRHVVALRGGLGNQLFQFAYALSLADQGRPVRLALSNLRQGAPALFGVPVIGDRARCMMLPLTRLLPAPGGRFPAAGGMLHAALGPARLVADATPQGRELMDAAPPAWWFGYWQRLRYAERLAPLLRDGLFASIAPAVHSASESPLVRIHVRRGDYAGNPWALPVWWYRRALEAVDRMAGGALSPEVVTNDAGWCEHHLELGRDFKALPSGSALDDMKRLAAADFLVISRSTFSWWAGFGGRATVVVPSPWFPDRSPGEIHDMIPAAWQPCDARP